ncbi:MAG: serine hydrolase [Phenylobacterium sp.]|nr:serine hydrolase [Phenylobacterium sp.]
MRTFIALTAFALLALSPPATAQSFTPAEVAKIDEGVQAALSQRSVPSASIAVVRGGQIVFTKAYGRRSLSPSRAANIEARYNIASVTKQITATAVLMLADEGKLSLDDTIDRWMPELTDASRITVRQVLSHTAGYKGFFTAEILPLEGRRATSPQAIADGWGRRPLDFTPGSDWRYSNTDYTIAGLIVERVSGQPLATYLRKKIFEPLGMTSAAEFPGQPMPATDAQGYSRYVRGPARAAPIVGAGWAFGAGGWSMTASDLARWDQGVLGHRLLSAQGYAAQQTAAPLTNGKTAPYGLGVFVDQVAGHRRIHHPGSEFGYLTENRIYPDDGAAVVVMVNGDFGDPQDEIADQIEGLLLAQPPAAKHDPRRPRPTVDAAVRPQEVALAHRLYDQVAAGKLDRSLLTPDANAYFSRIALADYRRSLAPLGPPTAFERLMGDRIDGLDVSLYRLLWPDQLLVAVLRTEPGGRVASFTIFSPL